MMKSSLFIGSRLKIERANYHIDDLEEKLAALRRRNPYRFVLEAASEPGLSRLVVRVREEFPPYFPLIIGDAVHNLRAALDLLACDLVRCKGGRVDHRLAFPFGRDEEDFERNIKKTRIEQAGSQVVNFIREIKPYTGGNEALRAVHDLDIDDKHKLLIPVLQVTPIPSFTAKTGEMDIISIIGCGIIDPPDGFTPFTFPTPQRIDMLKDVRASFDILIGDGQPFEHQPVTGTLHQLAETVNNTVVSLVKLMVSSL